MRGKGKKKEGLVILTAAAAALAVILIFLSAGTKMLSDYETGIAAVARKDIPKGTGITAENVSELFELREVNQSMLPGQTVTDLSQMEGKVLSGDLQENEIVTKKDMNDLKRLVYDLMQNEPQQETVVTEPTTSLVLRNLYNQEPGQFSPAPSPTMINHREDRIQDTEAVIEESFSIEEKERELILKALEKNHGKRKLAAKDLGISERTLYRKLKEYNLEN